MMKIKSQQGRHNSRGGFLLQYTSEEKGHECSSTGVHPKAGKTSLEGIQTEVMEELGVRNTTR